MHRLDSTAGELEFLLQRNLEEATGESMVVWEDMEEDKVMSTRWVALVISPRPYNTLCACGSRTAANPELAGTRQPRVGQSGRIKAVCTRLSRHIRFLHYC